MGEIGDLYWYFESFFDVPLDQTGYGHCVELSLKHIQQVLTQWPADDTVCYSYNQAGPGMTLTHHFLTLWMPAHAHGRCLVFVLQNRKLLGIRIQTDAEKVCTH